MPYGVETIYPLAGKRIWVAGHRGMVGSALVRRLASEDPAEILAVGRDVVDLRDTAAVLSWMTSNRPDTVFVSAAKVGGIHAHSTYPADFLYDNLMIAAKIIHPAHLTGVEELFVSRGRRAIYSAAFPEPPHPRKSPPC